MYAMIITAFFLLTGQAGQVVVTDIPNKAECEAAIPRYQASLEGEAVAAGHTPGVDVVFEFQCVPM